MENDSAAIDINLSSKPCNGNIARAPTVLRAATIGVVQAGHPGVNAANVLPNAEAPLPLMDISLEPLILKINKATLIPASVAVRYVNPKDAAIYAGPSVSATTESGTRESVR